MGGIAPPSLLLKAGAGSIDIEGAGGGTREAVLSVFCLPLSLTEVDDEDSSVPLDERCFFLEPGGPCTVFDLRFPWAFSLLASPGIRSVGIVLGGKITEENGETAVL